MGENRIWVGRSKNSPKNGISFMDGPLVNTKKVLKSVKIAITQKSNDEIFFKTCFVFTWVN